MYRKILPSGVDNTQCAFGWFSPWQSVVHICVDVSRYSRHVLLRSSSLEGRGLGVSNDLRYLGLEKFQIVRQTELNALLNFHTRREKDDLRDRHI